MKYSLIKSADGVRICRLGKPGGTDSKGDILTLIDGDSEEGRLIRIVEELDGLSGGTGILKTFERLLSIPLKS